ncbi:MAG TPA: YbaB/EbfC family nucleoid-associated protein [Acidimicrobiales bacterium]|nr:YbaB/EbfC family nucleoid-associated protein [Acidimicrobiales bacterium]
MTDETPDTPETPEVVGGPVPPAGGLPGLGDLGGLLASAQEAVSAQAEIVNREVEGTAGGGVVTVRMTGNGEVVGVTISPEVVDPDDVEMLQDLVLAALHDATAKVTELQREALGVFGNLDLSGLGQMLGGLGGLGRPGESGR